MLKKIHVDQLCLGMHIHEFCGSWMEHPFWRENFLLEKTADIQRIRESSITELWIDTGKGLDITQNEASETVEHSETAVTETLLAAAAHADQPERIPLEQEIRRAQLTCNKAKEAVISMFNEVRMGQAISTAGAEQMVDEISSSVMRNPGALISLARLKSADDYTYMHSVAVCALMVALARQLNLDEATTREIGMAGLLHDLGKARMPHEVLNKPGRLTNEEFAIVQRHPVEGYHLLVEGQAVGEIPLDVCLHHHEKTDGSGYPDGLPGEQISLHAKMGAICDVYDAITSNRPYKTGWEPAESIRKMAEWCQGHFDALVFRAFVKSIGIYPVGSLVRLESGRLGIVTDQTEASLLTPVVKVFFSAKSQTHISPLLLDLSRPGTHDKIVSHEDPAKWGLHNLDALWMGAV